jgi:hypothetical protein
MESDLKTAVAWVIPRPKHMNKTIQATHLLEVLYEPQQRDRWI